MFGQQAIRCVLIDDHEEEHEIFALAIKATGLPIICHYYHFADEALQNLYHRVSPEPKLIFLDVNIPRMNGLDFLRKLKAIAHLRHIPVYVYSVGNYPDHIQIAMDLGATAYLVKPDRSEELVTMLNDVFSKYLPNNIKR